MRYIYKERKEMLIRIVEENRRQEQLQEIHDRDTSNVVQRNILPPTRGNLRINQPPNNFTYNQPGTPDLEFERLEGGRRKKRKKSRKKRRKSRKKSRRKKKKSRRKRRKTRKIISTKKKHRRKY